MSWEPGSRLGPYQILESRNYSSFALSPDGTRLAVTLAGENNDNDIWIWSQERKTLTRDATVETAGHRPLPPAAKATNFSARPRGRTLRSGRR